MSAEWGTNQVEQHEVFLAYDASRSKEAAVMAVT